jgi:hypothetical protein
MLIEVITALLPSSVHPVAARRIGDSGQEPYRGGVGRVRKQTADSRKQKAVKTREG